MAERVDVCIVGSGFGGSISAYRLAELYRAAGADPSILVLERGRATSTPTSASRWTSTTSRDVYGLIQGQGAQVVVGERASAAARTSTSRRRCARRRETFERRDHRPDDGPDRRMWPSADQPRDARPLLRARRARRCACSGRRWNQVSKSGGLWAATLRRGRPHLRPRAAGDRPRAAASTRSGATPAASSAPRTR